MNNISLIIGQKMRYANYILPGLALIVSILSYYFLRKSWNETYRPIVTARVETRAEGNIGVVLNIIVQNSGNRPAKNVQLLVDHESLASSFLANVDDPLRNAVERCFSEQAIIPILENGRMVTNSFGLLSNDRNSTWRPDSILNIKITYEGIHGRKFLERIPLKISSDTSFAGSSWERPN